jgi:hypothetical protein
MPPQQLPPRHEEQQRSNLAQIIADPASPPIDCTLIDYSAGGACLEVAEQPELPQHFDLLYGNDRKSCRMVWTRGQRIGVVF